MLTYPGYTSPSHAPGRLCVRDALFLLAHDEYRKFRPRLHPVVLELGLAAGVIVDLVLLGRARVTEAGQVFPLGLRPPADHRGADVITWTALAALHASSRGRDLPTVAAAFDVLAPGLTDRTRAHLVACRVLTPRRRWAGRVRYGPATANTTAYGFVAPRIVVQDRVADPFGLALCALVQALGLHEALYLCGRSELDRELTGIVDAVRAMPAPWDGVPRITDALRAEADERAVAVYR